MALSSALTVLACVWKVCQDKLDPVAMEGMQSADTGFLVIVRRALVSATVCSNS